MRQELEKLPPALRTRERYEAALNAFRAIYHQSPRAARAPAAVAAVADLLAERGRVLGDAHALQSAIGQYEFLRKQYPNSLQTANALLLEGDICRQDLKDLACAEDKFRTVLSTQADTSFAEQAAIELKEMQPPATPRAAGAKNTRARVDALTASSSSPVPAPALAAVSPRSTAHPDPLQKAAASPSPPASALPAAFAGASQAASASVHTAARGHVVLITGMRHWSNPTSTRIAIDLGGQVEYEAARVPDPDRIFFDLHGARLAPSLNGRQVEVIDDGYLKRIRAAQFHPDVTRVVLDVTDVSQYSAFLLPNPWRLIIDIHSEKGGSRTPPDGVAAIGPSSPRLSRGDSTLADVARLSDASGKVQATAGPTSGPVSARVPGTTPALDMPASAQLNPPSRLPTGNAAGNAAPAAKPERGSSGSGKSAKTDAASIVAGPDAAALPASSSGKRGRAQAVSDDAAAVPHAADPDADGQRSLVRALGLKVGRIVIDAGHGGHDSGTLGPGGIQEKDVVLDVALRAGKLLHQRLGAEIVYTRDDDTFIPLETRTAIANKAQADLFLSIHANSSAEPDARGVETYYLNFTSEPNALEVAARENAVSTQSVHQLSDLVRKITLKDKISESREFAADVDAGLYAGLRAGNPGLKDRGVKKAPFVVLIGAQMPSILAEISFLTNPDDASQLRQASYRQRIAESLDTGVERYLRGLSGGTRPMEKARSSAKGAARGLDEPAGQ